MKKILVIFLLFIAIFSLASCKDTANPSKNNTSDNAPLQNNPTNTEVTLYFANKEYIETGDEELKHLISEKRVVEYRDIPLEEGIIKELIKGPVSDKLSTLIPDEVVLLDVETKDGTAFVNFKSEGLHGGSLQEGFTITQIVKSLLELEGIERVQFLIDGQKSETLMGHFEILEPFDQETIGE